MKRDMDLIRALLLKAEEQPPYGPFTNMEFPGRSEDEMRFHAELAQEAGLIEAEFMMDGFFVRRLTYAGHEFLDAAREEKLWNKAKETVRKNAGTLTMEALKTALATLMQQAVHGRIT
jgi:Hypothetical protein (DUF2513)